MEFWSQEREIVERVGLDLTLEKAVAILKASELSQFLLKELECGSTSMTSDLDAVRKNVKGQETGNSFEIVIRVGGIVQIEDCLVFTRNCL